MPDIRCDRCGKTRSRRRGTADTLRNVAARAGWTCGLLDWPDWRRGVRPDLVDRCGACTREHGEPRPIGPHYPNRW